MSRLADVLTERAAVLRMEADDSSPVFADIKRTIADEFLALADHCEEEEI